MWDYVPTHFQYVGDVAAQKTSDAIAKRRDSSIAWTQVHTITNQSTCSIGGLSDKIRWLTWRHVVTREAPDRHQRGYRTIAIGRLLRSRSPFASWRHQDHPISIKAEDRDWRLTLRFMEMVRSSSNGWRPGRSLTARSDRPPHLIFIGQRSVLDRDAIVARSWHDRGQDQPRLQLLQRGIMWLIILTSSDGDRWSINITIDARSWRDHGPDWSGIKANSWPIPKLRHHPKEPLPWPLQTASTTASMAHEIGLIFPLKTHVFSLCSSTFDRFVKELSKFRGRYLVHHDPPAIRLDCEAIWEGLIANFSLISSNFPLEFWTSARKNPSKFASIYKNWSPILAAIRLVVRFDRLSGGNLSFY